MFSGAECAAVYKVKGREKMSVHSRALVIISNLCLLIFCVCALMITLYNNIFLPTYYGFISERKEVEKKGGKMKIKHQWKLLS